MNKKRTKETVQEELKKDGFSLLSEYNGYNNSIQAKGIKCKHEFSIVYYTYDKHKKKNHGVFSCPVCARKKNAQAQKLKFPEIKKFVSDSTEKEYKLISSSKDYETSRDSKLLFLHKTCGNPFHSTLSNFKIGRRCPVCAAKSGESNAAQLLKRILEHTGIPFEAEKLFDDCLNEFSGAKLRFDLFIPSINLAIEIDGEQHFVPIKQFGGHKSLKDTQYRDYIKDKFCLEKKISLIRIPLVDVTSKKKRAFSEVKRDIFNLLLDLHKKMEKRI